MTDMELTTGVGRGYRYYAGPVLYPFGKERRSMSLRLPPCTSARSSFPRPVVRSAGHGLSLTTFSLSAQGFPAAPAFVTESAPSTVLNFSVTVQNTGAATGDEVVQVRLVLEDEGGGEATRSCRCGWCLRMRGEGRRRGRAGAAGPRPPALPDHAYCFAHPPPRPGPGPLPTLLRQVYMVPVALPTQPASRLLRQLVDYERVHLGPGEATTLTFSVTSATFRVVDADSGDILSVPGQFRLLFTNGVYANVTSALVTVSGGSVVAVPFPA